MKHVNVYGPQGCGKTRNAEKLRVKYGCDVVVEADETEGKTVRPEAGKRYLLLTHWPVTHRDVTTIPFEEALR